MEASKEETPEKTEEETKTASSEGQKYDGGEIPKVSPPEKKKK